MISYRSVVKEPCEQCMLYFRTQPKGIILSGRHHFSSKCNRESPPRRAHSFKKEKKVRNAAVRARLGSGSKAGSGDKRRAAKKAAAAKAKAAAIAGSVLAQAQGAATLTVNAVVADVTGQRGTSLVSLTGAVQAGSLLWTASQAVVAY